jgi:hypothetical protein
MLQADQVNYQGGFAIFQHDIINLTDRVPLQTGVTEIVFHQDRDDLLIDGILRHILSVGNYAGDLGSIAQNDPIGKDNLRDKAEENDN